MITDADFIRDIQRARDLGLNSRVVAKYFETAPVGLNARCVRCGHTQATHTHLRRGSDCGLCACRRYRRTRWFHRT